MLEREERLTMSSRQVVVVVFGRLKLIIPRSGHQLNEEQHSGEAILASNLRLTWAPLVRFIWVCLCWKVGLLVSETVATHTNKEDFARVSVSS